MVCAHVGQKSVSPLERRCRTTWNCGLFATAAMVELVDCAAENSVVSRRGGRSARATQESLGDLERVSGQ